MVICLELSTVLHMAQLMPLPLTVSCFSKIQIGYAFLIPAHLGGPRQRAVKRVRSCVRVCYSCRKMKSANCCWYSHFLSESFGLNGYVHVCVNSEMAASCHHWMTVMLMRIAFVWLIRMLTMSLNVTAPCA